MKENNLNEDFVPFELSVKLKEKGFREECFATYTSYGEIFKFNEIDTNKIASCNLNIKDFRKCYNYYKENNIDAPTISQVLKWLRNEKKVYVSILPFATHSTIINVAFYYLIEYNSTGETMESIEQDTYCAKWKDSALAGIEYVLDNLILL